MPTAEELRYLQALPLDLKIRKTQNRIIEWVREFGTDGVYVSFSGGKDSTVLLHIVRELFPSIEAVFVDTGLEYPEIRQFAKSFDNVTVLKPEMNFKQVIEKYGYPFFSKEVSQCVYGARRYIDNLTDRQTDRQTEVIFDKFHTPITTEEYRGLVNMLNSDKGRVKGSPQKIGQLFGIWHKGKAIIPSNLTEQDRSFYSYEKYKFMLDAPFRISHKCCDIMKKKPVHLFEKTTNKVPIIGTLAEESFLRKQKWLQNGCNSFEGKYKKSQPLSFWTEQDILQYIKDNNIEICSVYGDIVPCYTDSEFEGQIGFDELGVTDASPLLKTTGCNRTGCVFCGFGCHLEKGEGRFERLKRTHPKHYEYIMKSSDEGGLNYKVVIDWINENGNFNIKY